MRNVANWSYCELANVANIANVASIGEYWVCLPKVP